MPATSHALLPHAPRVQVVVQYLPVVRYYRRLEAESKAAKPDANADVCAAMHPQPALTTTMHHVYTSIYTE